MAFKLEITTLAEEEYSSAFHYYEEHQSGLGDKFEKETDRLIDKLKANPHLFQRNTSITEKLYTKDSHIISFMKL